MRGSKLPSYRVKKRNAREYITEDKQTCTWAIFRKCLYSGRPRQ